MQTETLDTLGLKCPLPVLRARKKLSELAAGDCLIVLTDDPGAPPDFLAFCEANGHIFVSNTMESDQISIKITKVGL